MTARRFVYNTLSNYEPLTDLIGEATPRIFAKKTMTSSVEEHPYIVYKLGNESVIDLAEDHQQFSTQFLQIWVHDFSAQDVADYALIDTIISKIKDAFKLQRNPEDGVWAIRFLETSQDLDDDTLNTVFRYVRFSITKEELI